MPVQEAYLASHSSSQRTKDFINQIATSLDGSHTVDREATALHEFVDPSELLDHFVQTVDHIWIGSAPLQTNLQKHGPQLALRSPYLLHAMLSFSAYHLAYICPAAVQYNLAGTSHYSKSLEAYSTALQNGLENADVDAIFSCCMLLNLIAFKSLAHAPPETEMPGRADELYLDIPGLLSIRGFQIIQRDPRVESRLEQCIWNDIFNQCTSPTVTRVGSQMESSKVMHTLVQLENLCNIENNTDPGTYDHALDSLRVLMQRGIGHQTIGILFRFTQAIENKYLELLEDKDSKALLLLYFWLSMATEVNQWWALESARSESRKILTFLKEHAEPAVKVLLDFPKDFVSLN
jgi:hypothetical protein